jgi:hypothetical protein
LPEKQATAGYFPQNHAFLFKESGCLPQNPAFYSNKVAGCLKIMLFFKESCCLFQQIMLFVSTNHAVF